MSRARKVIDSFKALDENKTLVRGQDRLTANITAKEGNNVKLVAVDHGSKIALHLKYADGDMLAELPKTKASVDEFEFALKKKGFIPMVGGKLKITNE